MMDPASTFQVAIGAAQLVELGVKIAKELHEIWKSGSSLTAENAALDRDTTHLNHTNSILKAHLNKLQTSGVDLTENQKQVKSVAQEIDTLATELLQKLGNLKIVEQPRKRDIFKKYMKSMREDSSLKNIQTQLERRQNLLNTDILFALFRDINIEDAKQKQVLEQVNLADVRNMASLTDLSLAFRETIQSLENTLKSEFKIATHRHRMKVQNEYVQEILQSLHFATIHARQEEVRDAFGSTFEWVFDYSSNWTKPWDNFAQWLAHGNGIYWINGKAGSGKSTLVNYIVQKPELKKYLNIWSANESLIIPTFFFWRAGTREQKSINGLLRSIIYQMISSSSHFVSMIPHDTPQREVWTTKRLFQTLQIFIENLPQQTKICLIVDGLDEFDGDSDSQESLLQLICNISKHEAVKVCVSSRPDAIFLTVFAQCKSMRLQDLTANDVFNYVRGKLFENQTMQKYHNLFPEQVEHFVRRICGKAEGVMLWVHLVVQDMLRDLTGQEELATLQRRLETLDNSLEGLFSQLITRIDQFHLPRAAGYLKFLVHSKEPLRILHIAFGLEEELLSSILHQQLLSNPAVNDQDKFYTKKLETLTTRLINETAGFLNVQVACQSQAHQTLNYFGDTGDIKTFERYPPPKCFCWPWQLYGVYMSVEFIHRSALDFFSHSDKAQDLLSRATISEGAIPSLMLKAIRGVASVYFSLLRKYYHSPLPLRLPDRHILDIPSGLIVELYRLSSLFHTVDGDAGSYHLFEETDQWLRDELKQLQDVATSKTKYPYCYIEYERLIDFYDPKHFLANFLLRRGVGSWALTKINRKNMSNAAPLFASIVQATRYRQAEADLIGAQADIIEKLLELGLDPNQPCIDPWASIYGKDERPLASPWCLFLDSLGLELKTEAWQKLMFIFETFILHGADVNASKIAEDKTYAKHRNSHGWKIKKEIPVLEMVKSSEQGLTRYGTLIDKLCSLGANATVTPISIDVLEIRYAKRIILGTNHQKRLGTCMQRNPWSRTLEEIPIEAYKEYYEIFRDIYSEQGVDIDGFGLAPHDIYGEDHPLTVAS